MTIEYINEHRSYNTLIHKKNNTGKNMVESRAIHSQPATLANIQPPKVLNHCLFYLHVYCAPTTKKKTTKKIYLKR